MPEDNLPLQEGETLLKESAEAVFLRPRQSLIGRPCRAALTDRRVLFRQTGYDLAARREAEPGPVLHEFQVSEISDVRADSESAEHSIGFDLRSATGQRDKVLLILRDEGWHLGAPLRLAERDEWLRSVHGARKGPALDLKPAAPALSCEAGKREAPGPSAPAGEAEPGCVPMPAALLNGKYDILRKIGEGGMGEVFEGMDRTLDRPVAIKRMRPEIKSSNRDKKAFLQEARTSASLHHPFIVDIYEIVESGEDIYLVFEFVAGKTISQLLDISLRLPPARVKRILRCVCEALSFAHSRKFAHRDLKPSNIILSDQGYAKVMDFGIARLVKDTSSRVSQLDCSGTRAYMAPEQELGKSSIPSDIFALGATAYEMLTGDLPFVGPGFYDQKERMAFPPILSIAPDVPGDLAAAVERCLRFESAQRFQSAAEFARAMGLEIEEEGA